LTDEGIPYLNAYLEGARKQLYNLDISDNNLTDVGIEEMAPLIGRMGSLLKFHFKRNNFGRRGRAALLEEFPKMKALRSLDL